MSPRVPLPWRKTAIFAAFSLLLGLTVGGWVLFNLYRSTLEQERTALSELVESQARLIEAVARFDARFSGEAVAGGGFAATLLQVSEAQGSFTGFGRTGVFVLGERIGDSIHFHAVSLPQAGEVPGTLPLDEPAAAPMQAALRGEAGTMEGADFRGVRVLAAFRPLEVEGRDLGLVAKKDLAEVRGPVLRSALRMAAVLAVLTALLSLLYHFLGQPFFRRMEETEAELESTEEALEETEEALAETERRFQATFEQAAVGIAHVSPQGRFLRMNRRFAGIIGYSVEEAVALTFQEITHPDDLDADLDLVTQVLEGNLDTYEMEKRYLRKDGSVVWILLTVSLVRRPDGQPDYFISVIQDISERVRSREESRRYAEILARSNEDLQQFAYVASHDLQEPLRMVSSFTQLLADRYRGKLDGDADEFIDYAVDGANRMQSLIQGLLKYSRVETRGGDFESVDAGEVLDGTLVDLQAAIHEVGATIAVGELPTVLADRVQLGRVFLNLLQNALRFGREGGHIRVDAERAGAEWVFRVQDDGPGIDSRYHERIFLMFQRLGPREQFSETGIGLSICKRIVQRHGGRIWVESAPGGGASFYFTIPDRSGSHEQRKAG